VLYTTTETLRHIRTFLLVTMSHNELTMRNLVFRLPLIGQPFWREILQTQKWTVN